MSLQYLHCPSFLVNNRLKKRPKKRLNGNFDSLPSQSPPTLRRGNEGMVRCSMYLSFSALDLGESRT